MYSKKGVVKEWFRMVWAEEETAAIHEMFVPGQAQGLKKGEGLGQDEYAEFHQLVLNLVKDVPIQQI